ncbi:hypothetical protein GCM10008965_27490 [Methylorubrum aminovorans]|nr:hypothetical protein GCM10025880_06400 [Methylorubrum aminovorans]
MPPRRSQISRLQLCEYRPRDQHCDHLAIRRSKTHINGIASVDEPNAGEGPYGDGERGRRFIGHRQVSGSPNGQTITTIVPKFYYFGLSLDAIPGK